MITITNADAALKDYYLDAVNAQLNGEVSPFFNAIEKTGENVFGKDVKLAMLIYDWFVTFSCKPFFYGS